MNNSFFEVHFAPFPRYSPSKLDFGPFHKADFQTLDGPSSMADFQKVVPLIVKKHLLYDGKFLRTFWPLTAFFFYFCQISQSTQNSSYWWGISQVGLLYGPFGTHSDGPKWFFGCPWCKKHGQKCKRTTFQTFENLPPSMSTHFGRFGRRWVNCTGSPSRLLLWPNGSKWLLLRLVTPPTDKNGHIGTFPMHPRPTELTNNWAKIEFSLKNT